MRLKWVGPVMWRTWVGKRSGDRRGRRLLYVAMTRAQQQLHLLIPATDGSTLVARQRDKAAG